MNNHVIRVSFLLSQILISGSLLGAQVDVTLSPSAASFVKGQTFTEVIAADISAPIVGFGFDYTFNTAQLSLTNVAVGPLWFGAPPPETNGIAGLAFPTPVSGNGVLLATMDFTALSPGTSGSISLFYNYGNLAEGFPLAVGGYATNNLPNVPEPAPLPLALVGIVSLLAYRFAAKICKHYTRSHPEENICMFTQ